MFILRLVVLFVVFDVLFVLVDLFCVVFAVCGLVVFVCQFGVGWFVCCLYVVTLCCFAVYFAVVGC